MDNNKKMELMNLMKAMLGEEKFTEARQEAERQAREEVKKEVADGKHTIATKEAEREISLLIGSYVGTKITEDSDTIIKTLGDDNIAFASSLIVALCGVIATIMPSHSKGNVIDDIESLKSIVEFRRELLGIEVNTK